MNDRVTRILEAQKARQKLSSELGITEVALSVWKYITDYLDRMGYMPSYTEISVSCYISIQAVTTQLKQLDHNGYIQRGDKHLARATTLLVRCPLSVEVVVS